MRALSLLRSDDGAVAVITALLLGAGVLTGMAALVTGTGMLDVAQSSAQSAADAGALAVAQSCADGNCEPSLAGQYAARSFPGSQAQACGSQFYGYCPPGCPLPRLSGRGWADVMVTAGTVLPFGGARTVTACSQASWGSRGIAKLTG